MDKESYDIYKLAKRVINIVHVYEEYAVESNTWTDTNNIREKMLDVFFVYDNDGNLIDDYNELSRECIDETSQICKTVDHCENCYMARVQVAISSINLTYGDMRIRNLNLVNNCSVLYFLINYKFRPKINTDDWENIY